MNADVLLKIACTCLLVALHLYSDWAFFAKPYSWFAAFSSAHLGTKLEFNLASIRIFTLAFAFYLFSLIVLAILDAEFPQARLYAAFLQYASCILMLSCSRTRFAQHILNLGSCILLVVVCVHTCAMDASVFYVGAQMRFITRICMTTLLSDVRLLLVQQFLFTLINLGKHHEFGQSTFGVSPLGQAIQAEFFQILYIWTVFFLFEIYRSARSDARISACEAWASKRLLSVLCDADVQLNGDLEIVGPCCRLPQIVNPSHRLPNSAFGGTSFTDLVAPDDKSRFIDFIRASPLGDMELAPPPVSSIHLRLACAEGLHEDVRLVHVPISACDGLPSHILGILVDDDPGHCALGEDAIEQQAHAWSSSHAELGNDPAGDVQSSKSSDRTSSAGLSTLSDFEPCPDISQVTLAIDPFANALVQSVFCLFGETANGPHLLDFVRRSQRDKFDAWLQAEVNNSEIFAAHPQELDAAGKCKFKNLQCKLGFFRIAVDETRLVASTEEEDACLEIELVGIKYKPVRISRHSSKLHTIEESGMRRRRKIDPNSHF